MISCCVIGIWLLLVYVFVWLFVSLGFGCFGGDFVYGLRRFGWVVWFGLSWLFGSFCLGWFI